MDVRAVRFFNVYGPRMRQHVIQDLIGKMLVNPAGIEFLGDRQQVRKYLHADDAARALAVVATSGQPGGIYNAGTGRGIRVRDLVVMVARILGFKDMAVTDTNQSWAGDVRAAVADVSGIRALGFTPSIGLEEGLAETVNSLRARFNA